MCRGNKQNINHSVNHKQLSKSARVRNLKREGADKLYEDDSFLVVHPKVRAASVLYGKGTKWCTAAKRHNAFTAYNEVGNLYIVIDKLSGKKYQFHFETDSFMTDSNKRLPLAYLHNISATQGLIDFFTQEHTENLFVVQSTGHGQSYLVRKNDKYGVIEAKYHQHDYLDEKSDALSSLFDNNVVYMLFDFLVDVEYDYARLQPPSHLVLLKKDGLEYVYNLLNGSLKNLAEVRNRSTIERITLQDFISSVFPVGKAAMINFLQAKREQLKEKIGFKPNCIIANKYTLALFNYFSSLKDNQAVDSMQYAKDFRDELLTSELIIVNNLYQLCCGYDFILMIADNSVPNFDFLLGYSECCENVRMVG